MFSSPHSDIHRILFLIIGRRLAFVVISTFILLLVAAIVHTVKILLRHAIATKNKEFLLIVSENNHYSVFPIMDYHQSWSCEVATEDFSYHWCQLSVDFMSGCFFVDLTMLCPIQEATILVSNNGAGYLCFAAFCR